MTLNSSDLVNSKLLIPVSLAQVSCYPDLG